MQSHHRQKSHTGVLETSHWQNTLGVSKLNESLNLLFEHSEAERAPLCCVACIIFLQITWQALLYPN